MDLYQEDFKKQLDEVLTFSGGMRNDAWIYKMSVL